MSTAYPTEESVLHDDQHQEELDLDLGLGLDLGELNLTSEDIDFDEIDDDLERFQEDETVQQALRRGVDLRKYGLELAAQLKEVCVCVRVCVCVCVRVCVCVWWSEGVRMRREWMWCGGVVVMQWLL
jgi:hypothetical protein